MYIYYIIVYFLLLISLIFCEDLEGNLSKPQFLLGLSGGCILNLILPSEMLKTMILWLYYTIIILFI